MTKSRGIGMGVGGGRPTKYGPHIIKLVEKYLADCQDEEGEFHKTRGEKSDSYERTLTVRLPKIEDLVLILDVSVDTINQWEKEKPEFSETLTKIRKEQHKRLVENALSGKYNPVIAKLMLSSNHGYKEKSETENKVNIQDFTFTDEEKQKLLDLI